MKNIIEITENLAGLFSKNSPTILTGMAVAGLVTTTILGIKATPKALQVIDDFVWDKYEEEVEDKDKVSFAEWLGVETDDGYSWSDRVNYPSKMEVIKLTWKVYLPTVITGAVTVGCIIGAHHISLRRNAALASLYGLTETAFKEYKSKVVETIGRNKELKIRDEIASDRIKRNPPGTSEIILTGRGPVLCFDTLSGRYFRSDIEQIRKVVNELNHNMLSEMFLPLNELYYALGLSNISIGDQIGWDVESGMVEISFSTQLTSEGEPCLVLNYNVEPKHIR